MPEFIIPFGPFHMVLLHLPIGALTAIWFLEFLLEKNDDKHKNQAIGLLHLLLLLSCGLTVVLGLSYEEFGQYGDEIEQHEFWGLIFAGCIVATYLCYWIHRKLGKRSSKLFYMLALLAATITMVITAHQGGELVHGKGFLSKPFKDEKRQAVVPTPLLDESSNKNTGQARIVTQATTISALNAPMVDTINGADRIDPITTPIAELVQTRRVADPRIALFETSQAIFERNCYKCHGATKEKGGYRLDEQHSINLGGKSKLPAIVPGNAEQSELMYRMLLPHDDDDAMPPEEKDPVSSEDIDLVRQWIEAGAYWPDEAMLSAAPGDTVKLGDADTDQLIEQISSTGVKAEYNAWDDESIRIDLGVVGPGQLDQAIKQLDGFSNKLTWLDCSELELPQGFFQQLEQCIKLQRLHLNGTDVTDKQLDALSQLADLNYLNLYNTQISDAGLESLHASSSLRKIFLSQTQVTANGIAKLKKSLPDLEVVHQP
jgi:mono/diheme cytochrome c family protein